MAKKFKINDHVIVKSTNEDGYIKAREVTPVEGSKRINIEYVVKLGNGFNNWKSFKKDELIHYPTNTAKDKSYTKVYDVVDGYKITMYAKVISKQCLFGKVKGVKIGYSIYNPNDEYDEKLGIKIAKTRSQKEPFCTMSSSFSGEFNEPTVLAIMDVKADYIKNNFDKFLNKRFKK